MNMPACTPFNEHKKGLNLLSICTCSVLGKQNVQAKKVYWTEWSTIQGVIVRVISKSAEREARSRFEITSTITP